MIGVPHLQALTSSPGARVVAACDVDPDAAERVPDGIAFGTDPEAALDAPGVEAVFVCTPQGTHRTLVESALARGLAVFCEKPIAHDLADADAMIAAAAATGRLL